MPLVTPWGVLSNTDVPGEDLPCIGRPNGAVRGIYSNTTYEDGSYDIEVAYYFLDSNFDEMRDYFVSKLVECNFNKDQETTSGFVFPGMDFAQIYSAEYSKGDDSLSLIVGSVQGDMVFTVAHLSYSHYEYNDSMSEEEQMPEEQREPQEVTPVGVAAVQNENIKPVLSEVFGKVYLVSYASSPFVYLKYDLKELATANDVSALASAFESRGYTLLSATTETENSVVVVKNNNMITVTFYNKGDYVEVSIVPLS